jgi:hypothetical protein
MASSEVGQQQKILRALTVNFIIRIVADIDCCPQQD